MTPAMFRDLLVNYLKSTRREPRAQHVGGVDRLMGGMGWLGKPMVSGFDFPNKTNPRMGWFPLRPLSTSQSQHQSDAHLQQHRLGAYRSSMRSIAVEDMPCWKCWKFLEIRNAKKWILWWVMVNDWLIIVSKCLIMFNNGEFWLIMVSYGLSSCKSLWYEGFHKWGCPPHILQTHLRHWRHSLETNAVLLHQPARDCRNGNTRVSMGFL